MPAENSTTPGEATEFSRASLVAWTSIFFVLSLIKISNHVLWRDEWHAWAASRDARSLAELSANIRYEGHPALWHACLFLLSRATPSPFAMQCFHVLLATLSAFVVLRFAPFRRVAKALFVFGYFPFFEYDTIARDYVPGVLFLFTACALFTRRAPLWTVALSLGLAGNTNAFAFLVAVSLAGVLAWRVRESEENVERRLTAAFLFLGITGLSILQMIPPPDGRFAAGWRTSWDTSTARNTGLALLRGLLPLFVPGPHFWDTTLWDRVPWLGCLLGVTGSTAIALSVGRRPVSFLFWLASLAAFLAFSYAKYPGSVRHDGYVFVACIMAAWLAAGESERRFLPAKLDALSAALSRFRAPAATVVLGLHLLAGIVASGIDLKAPFSASRAAAQYVALQGLSDLPVACDPDWASEPLAGYLGHPVYVPASQRMATFVLWDDRRRWVVPPTEYPLHVNMLAANTGKDVLFFVNQPLSGPLPAGFQSLASFPQSNIPTENYFLYLARPAASPTAPSAPARGRRRRG